MDFRPPPRFHIARLPTPLEPLSRIGPTLRLDLWIKRDDLTGAALSGNKVRKLEYLAAEALEQGADTLVTCGAVGSNHARATAMAAARLGLRSHLLLRGEPRDPPDGNLLLDEIVGAGLTFIPPERWKDRDALMEEIAARLQKDEHRRCYVLPEGGSNAVGAMGYVHAFQELLEQERDAGLRIRHVVHATGSAGTTAGLALGAAVADRPDVKILGVAVCDDREYFDAKIERILDDAVEAGFVSGAVRRRARWTIVEGYKGRGYAQTTPEEMALIGRVAREEGIVLDPVYTGKAFAGLMGEAKAGYVQRDGATVFLHTGGIFGLFAFAQEIHALAQKPAESATPRLV